MEHLDQRDEKARVRSFSTYDEAQKAVDHLSDRRFPVQYLSIVAEDPRLVEDITGRHDYATAAAQGLFSGALVGGLTGFFFGLLSLMDRLVSAVALAFYGLLFGAVIGALVGVVAHWASWARCDFSSRRSIQATHYHLVADAHVVPEAVRLLDEKPIGGDDLVTTPV